MKIRNDFVTNSSSSSFILELKDTASVKVEDIFIQLKEYAKEIIDMREEVIGWAQKSLGVKLEFHTEYMSAVINGKEFCEDTENFIRVNKAVYDKFGIDLDDLSMYSLDWIKYNSYKEYTDNVELDDRDFHIFDFSKKCEDNEYVDDMLRYWGKRECYSSGELIKNEKTDENAWQNMIKSKYGSKQEACLHLVGRVCVLAGWLPSYIDEKLARQSVRYQINMSTV